MTVIELPDPWLYEEFNAVIYTDGSANVKDRTGGWAWVKVREDGAVLEKSSGAARDTTISRMELTAVLEALRQNQLGKMVIFSDSQYTVKSLTEWWPKWKKKGWVKSDGGEIMHLDLIQEGIELLQQSASDVRWIKGHHNALGNHLADELAGKARAKISKPQHFGAVFPSKYKALCAMCGRFYVVGEKVVVKVDEKPVKYVHHYCAFPEMT